MVFDEMMLSVSVRLRYRSLGFWWHPADSEFLGGIFLLAGEKTL